MVQQAEYRRNINKSSLILTVDMNFESDKDSIEMFRYNKIPYFLCMYAINKDLNEQFHYDITGKRSLDQLLEYKVLDYTLLLNILISFDQACVRAGDYMLAENDILLEPAFIFSESESTQLWYCCLPGNKNDICKQFQSFMEYLLQHLEHKDERAVKLAYGVYQRVTNDREALHSVLSDITTGNIKLTDINLTGRNKFQEQGLHENLKRTEKTSNLDMQLNACSVSNHDIPLDLERMSSNHDLSLNKESLSNQEKMSKLGNLSNHDLSFKTESLSKLEVVLNQDILSKSEKTSDQDILSTKEKNSSHGILLEQERKTDQDILLKPERKTDDQGILSKSERKTDQDISLNSERISNQKKPSKTEDLLNQQRLLKTEDDLYANSEHVKRLEDLKYAGKIPQNIQAGSMSVRMQMESCSNEKKYLPQKELSSQVSTEQTGENKRKKNHALHLKKWKKEQNNEQGKNQIGEKLKNLLLKKIYTNNARYQEEEIVFEEEGKEESVISNPTVCLMPDTGNIQNQFIYQGSDRTRDFFCKKGKIILGSSVEECNICIHFPMISRVHAMVEVNETGTFLEDMNSKNGTYVNGELLQYRERRLLKKGDIISLAGENYSFH